VNHVGKPSTIVELQVYFYSVRKEELSHLNEGHYELGRLLYCLESVVELFLKEVSELLGDKDLKVLSDELFFFAFELNKYSIRNITNIIL
jgi:hypothetical protein